MGSLVAPSAIMSALAGVTKSLHLATGRAVLPLLGLFLLPLILFAPVTLGSRTLLPADNLFAFEPYRSAAAELDVGKPHNALLSDLILENYAWKRFIVQSIRARQLPLWNPYLFAGSPFLASFLISGLFRLLLVFPVAFLVREERPVPHITYPALFGKLLSMAPRALLRRWFPGRPG